MVDGSSREEAQDVVVAVPVLREAAQVGPRVRRAIVAAGAALLIAAPVIQAAPPRVPAVAQETARSGWPHPTTTAELIGVRGAVFRYEVPTPHRSATIVCFAPGETIARTTCRIRNGRAHWTAYVRVTRNGSLTIRRGPVT